MAKRPSRISDLVSRVPIRIDACLGASQLLAASGFFVSVCGKEALITNWHVVAGRSPVTMQPLHPSGALPDRLSLSVPSFESSEGQSAIRWSVRILDLYEDEERSKPIWLVHSLLGEQLDVVALPLDGVSETALITATDARLGLDELTLMPGFDAFVVGFPLGMFGGAKFPIWKRGTIASEPDIDVDGLPKFYIDTATREGMSGAPVYAEEVGFWLPAGKIEFADRVIGKGRMFVGVYSGRIGAEDEFKAQLGIVWKRGALEEVVSEGRPGKSSFTMLSNGTA